ncbi:hypothetical protein EST38_g9529 [Candolleomyces aberdarensis]|uniref:Uncharacterized protein n=1 Tax=Candolleomyces aberdarensis TaxID=2316362 RepID=A0A4Q2DCL5_9AGAR|nr:hypothetical protein EST38_g9529 [Candolleomyces aberdarensis]
MAANPNFPKDLNIEPLNASKFASVQDDNFDAQAQQDAIQEYGIAGRVWEAAYPMILYINPPESWSFDPPSLLNDNPGSKHNWDRPPYSVLELGSGTGVVAACLAAVLRDGDLLIATDLPEVCPLLEKNLSKRTDAKARVAVRPLAWGTAQHVQEIRQEFNPLGLTHIICLLPGTPRASSAESYSSYVSRKLRFD